MNRGSPARVLRRAMLVGFWGWAFCAAAQSPVPGPGTGSGVNVKLLQFKVISSANGGEQLTDAASIHPGDVVEYRATYTNNTGRAVAGLQGELPIPDGMTYLPHSAKPGEDRVKLAGKDRVFGPEPQYRQKTGSGLAEPPPPAHFRLLRWDLGRLPASGSTVVSVRAKVDAADAVNEAR